MTVILIVEDEPIIRMIALDVLTEAGFSVLETSNGDAALKMLHRRANDIHAVFTDVHMPGALDGVGLVHEARRCWPWLRLLVASGKATLTSEDLPVRCRFVPKPYDLEEIVRHLRQLTQA